MDEKTKILARNIRGDTMADLTGCFDLVIGDGLSKVVIKVRDSGIDVRASELSLEVRPLAPNLIRVRATDWPDGTAL